MGKVKHDSVAKPLDRSPATGLGRFLDDGREAACELGCGFVASILRQSGVARDVKEGDRRRLSRSPRGDSSLVHVRLGGCDDVLEEGVLPEPALEPGNQPVDEVDYARALLVDEDVFLFVRDVQSNDPLVDRSVEELEGGL